jgi:PPOX class probable F420-dependent enzyme
MKTTIPATHYDLLDNPVVVMLATVNGDGQPQVTPVWCDRHGNEIWVNSAKGRRKDRNMRARPKVTVAVMDPQNAYRWLEVRGTVREIVEGDDAVAHIRKLSNDYFGRMFEMAPDEERVLYKIRPTHVNASG